MAHLGLAVPRGQREQTKGMVPEDSNGFALLLLADPSHSTVVARNSAGPAGGAFCARAELQRSSTSHTQKRAVAAYFERAELASSSSMNASTAQVACVAGVESMLVDCICSSILDFYTNVNFPRKVRAQPHGAKFAPNDTVTLRRGCFPVTWHSRLLVYHDSSTWKFCPSRVPCRWTFLATGSQTAATTAPNAHFASLAVSIRPSCATQ